MDKINTCVGSLIDYLCDTNSNQQDSCVCVCGGKDGVTGVVRKGFTQQKNHLQEFREKKNYGSNDKPNTTKKNNMQRNHE